MRRDDNFDINVAKKNLLKELLKAKFEDGVYKHLEECTEESMEELDAWLTERLNQYLLERETIINYYNERIYG